MGNEKMAFQFVLYAVWTNILVLMLIFMLIGNQNFVLTAVQRWTQENNLEAIYDARTNSYCC